MWSVTGPIRLRVQGPEGGPVSNNEHRMGQALTMTRRNLPTMDRCVPVVGFYHVFVDLIFHQWKHLVTEMQKTPTTDSSPVGVWQRAVNSPSRLES